MQIMKNLNDFLIWLVGYEYDSLSRYWAAVDYTIWDTKASKPEFIKQMDANNPDTLFNILVDAGFKFFEKAKIDYTNHMKREDYENAENNV